MCGLEDLDEVWRLIESGAADRPEDAGHWVRVYQELVATSESILAELRAGGDAAAADLLARRVAAFRDRLGYWRGELQRRSLPEP